MDLLNTRKELAAKSEWFDSVLEQLLTVWCDVLRASCVPTVSTASAEEPLWKAPIDPALKPNQPIQRNRVPSTSIWQTDRWPRVKSRWIPFLSPNDNWQASTLCRDTAKGRLWGSKLPVCPKRPSRGPTTMAPTKPAMPPVKCTTPLPAGMVFP